MRHRPEALGRRHKRILRTIGDTGMTAATAACFGSDFDRLEQLNLVVYWPNAEPRPIRLFRGVLPGRWYLTIACTSRRDSLFRSHRRTGTALAL